jgi:hypothetical protein
MRSCSNKIGGDGIRPDGGSNSNGIAGCGASIDVNYCSLMTCCGLGWSTDMGCCSSLIHCRPVWGPSILPIDVVCCSSPIRCRSRWSTGINIACFSSMTSYGLGRRVGISYIIVVMSSILRNASHASIKVVMVLDRPAVGTCLRWARRINSYFLLVEYIPLLHLL